MTHTAFPQPAARINAISYLLKAGISCCLWWCLMSAHPALAAFPTDSSGAAPLINALDSLAPADSAVMAAAMSGAAGTDSLVAVKNKKTKKVKQPDTTYYSPKKAAIWGASFPGLGQIYNKRYWKLPIVYGLLGTVTYFVVSNGQKLRQFNGYIRNSYEGVPVPSPYTNLTINQLETYRNSYRRNVQLASFGTVLVWGLSIVDAVVDAHMRSFDISDNLSMKIQPQIKPVSPQIYTAGLTYYTGLAVHLNIK